MEVSTQRENEMQHLIRGQKKTPKQADTYTALTYYRLRKLLRRMWWQTLTLSRIQHTQSSIIIPVELRFGFCFGVFSCNVLNVRLPANRGLKSSTQLHTLWVCHYMQTLSDNYFISSKCLSHVYLHVIYLVKYCSYTRQ